MAYLSDESRMAEEFVDAWLKREDWALSEWLDDFTGVNLPPLPPEEPYVWILVGLGTGVARAERERKLAQRLAQVLDAAPDREELDERRRQALYNVLVLCSEIRGPEILPAPLRRMFERALLPDIPLGYNLRFALRQALMMNPSGRDLEPLWVAMAKGEPHPFLPSDRYDAFHGVLLLPPDEQGEFTVSAMSAVLMALAEALDQEEQREQERHDRFGAMLDRVTECWGSDGYLARFWRESFGDRWPAWASTCIAAERFRLHEAAMAEIRRVRADIERPLLIGARTPRRQRGEIFNTMAVFVQEGHTVSPALGEALAQERASWHEEARLPVEAAAQNPRDLGVCRSENCRLEVKTFLAENG